MSLRWIPYSRVSMQRAGMLPIAVATAGERRPITLERASRDFQKVVSRKLKVPSERLDDFTVYVNSLRLWKRYRPLRERDPTIDDVIEVQDLWLADPALPAATGAITKEVVDDLPQLAVSLRLVRPENYTCTDRGRALLATLSHEHRALIRAKSEMTEPNPLTLPLSTQLLLLYALLEVDGDFVKEAYASEVVEGDFTRPDFADDLSRACRELVRRNRTQMRTGRDRKLLIRLEEWAKEIDRPRRSGSKWGGGRPPEQLATLRLEPYVDLGVLTRVNRYAYRYRLSDHQRLFFAGLIEAEEVDAFLRGALVGAWCETRGESRSRLSPEQVWPLIVESYEALRSPLGQASFIEVTLLAIGRLLEASPDQYFEIDDGVEAITEQRRCNPKRVRLGVNRRGQLTYMKIRGASI